VNITDNRKSRNYITIVFVLVHWSCVVNSPMVSTWKLPRDVYETYDHDYMQQGYTIRHWRTENKQVVSSDNGTQFVYCIVNVRQWTSGM